MLSLTADIDARTRQRQRVRMRRGPVSSGRWALRRPLLPAPGACLTGQLRNPRRAKTRHLSDTRVGEALGPQRRNRLQANVRDTFELDIERREEVTDGTSTHSRVLKLVQPVDLDVNGRSDLLRHRAGTIASAALSGGHTNSRTCVDLYRSGGSPRPAFDARDDRSSPGPNRLPRRTGSARGTSPSLVTWPDIPQGPLHRTHGRRIRRAGAALCWSLRRDVGVVTGGDWLLTSLSFRSHARAGAIVRPGVAGYGGSVPTL